MYAPQRVHVGGTPVDLCDTDDLVGLTTQWAATGRRATVVGVNAHVVNLCARQPAFATAIAAADLNFPDGQSIVWAARLLGNRPKGRVPLTHVTAPLCGAWAAAGLPVFLLGGKPGVAERAGQRLRAEHGVRIAGARHGYFGPADEPGLLAEINASGARILLVGLGNPRQELWLAEHRDALVPPVALTCGGWLDWTAGERRPCPPLVYRFGLEWAYRLAQEPRRLFARYVLGNPRFLYHVVRRGSRPLAVPAAERPMARQGS
ncbi:WecB/TagA/CpsF family glycosyltransferase [Actinocatenispora comari]|uniref:N-acetylmannosaminyltransferase n=1 Tax=Actinocatenispora comari TaxID=2807577 RepID=A0A8J4AM47_9ACTN|nr:WecB/TagA/CpsF family glycosyltransferase [Actinocatenispora comari]GIL31338.1 N-acetylmannosaminyltransferase [Actinocatenispora comari]